MAHQHATLAKRILSSLVLAPLAIGAVVHGDWPYHFFLALLFIIALREWGTMAGRLERPFIFMAAGAVYLLIGFTSFVILRADPAEGLVITLVLLIAVWASDIGAYVAGRAIGGPKVAPRISPGKTYAGLIGALLAAGLVPVIAALADYSILDASDLPVSWQSITIYLKILIIGILTGLSGQCGDFLISFIKRKAGVKDSGTLIPGHGGVLDRIDALLLAGPVYMVVLMFLV